MDAGAFDRVRQADGGRLGHGRVADQRALDLGGAQAVARDLDHVVDAPDDPEVAVLIALGRVAGGVLAGETAPILAHVALGVLEYRAQHGGPRLEQHQIAFLAVGHGVARLIQHFGLLPKERARARARLERHDRGGRDHKHARLGLPPGVDDGAAAVANDAVIPLPGLGVDRLAHRAEQPQGRQVVLVGPAFAKAHQPADGGGGGVEHADGVLGHQAPPAVGGREGRRAFVHEAGGGVEQRAIDDVGVACHPARVGGAPPAVGRLEVKDHLERGVDAHHVAAVGVQDGLGLAGGAGGIQDVERVFGVHHLGGAHVAEGRVGHQVVIPVVAAVHPAHLGAGASDHHQVLHGGAAGEGLIHDLLELDELAVEEGAVAGDGHARLRVVDAARQRVHGEAAVDYRVDGADLGAGQHGHDDLGDPAHVDGHQVAFGDAELLEHIGEARDFAVEAGIGELARVALFAFPDERGLVAGGGFEIAVQAVVDDVGLAADEPLEEGLLALVEHGVPGLVPFQLARLFGPEARQVFGRVLGHGVPVGHGGLLDDFGRRVEDFAFHLRSGRIGGHGIASNQRVVRWPQF